MNCEAGRIQQPAIRARPHTVSLLRRALRAGFSMTEVIISIAVMGVLAAIVIPGMAGIMDGSKEALANEKLEMLNKGLNSYAHAYKEYLFTPLSSEADELKIILDLEYRNPDEDRVITGSPFIDPRYRPAPSSSATDWRIVWTGYRFKLLRPGATGTGIKVVFDGSDYGTPYVFPPNYSSSGR